MHSGQPYDRAKSEMAKDDVNSICVNADSWEFFIQIKTHIT